MSALHLLAWAAQSAATPAPQAQPADDECRSSEGEIVVCGSRKANERYRLKPLHDGNQTPPKKLEIALGETATLSANLDSGGVAGSGNVPRFMVRFKLKF